MKKIVTVLYLVMLGLVPISAQNIDRLVKQARKGKTAAYESLAICYRDGEGLEKSGLNMLCIYEIYCLKTGRKVRDIVICMNDHHPYRLLTDILYMSSYDDTAKAYLDKIREVDPIEAQAIDVTSVLFSEDVSADIVEEMSDLADKGSELAAVYLGAYYQEQDMTSTVERENCYERLAEKYPIFYLLSGEVYIMKYHDEGGFANVQKAVEYYYKADSYGMLTPKYAAGLLSIYDYFGKNGVLGVSKRELKRLKRIAAAI